MRRRLKILVADDNLTDLQLLRSAVQRDAVTVDLHEVHDGEEVTEYLMGEGKFHDRRRHPFPDLLLLDLKMPRMGGADVLRWLRSRPECCQLPVVILSGSGLANDVKGAYKDGASTYFSKPTDFKHFQKLIRTLVEYWGMSELPDVPQRC
jgi:CheY-like chemotaxis protein